MACTHQPGYPTIDVLAAAALDAGYREIATVAGVSVMGLQSCPACDRWVVVANTTRFDPLGGWRDLAVEALAKMGETHAFGAYALFVVAPGWCSIGWTDNVREAHLVRTADGQGRFDRDETPDVLAGLLDGAWSTSPRLINIHPDARVILVLGGMAEAGWDARIWANGAAGRGLYQCAPDGHTWSLVAQ